MQHYYLITVLTDFISELQASQISCEQTEDRDEEGARGRPEKAVRLS